MVFLCCTDSATKLLLLLLLLCRCVWSCLRPG